MGLNEAQKKERSVYLEDNLKITECSQGKPYVFISYASDNWERVFKDAVVPMQRQYGLQVYVDKAFDKVNDKWIVPMLRNVRGADALVAFVSQSYIESYACFLELLTAVNNKKQIVFVLLEEQLHLGKTTDLPDIERGVKNEILIQGANIATNTNNTSNDIMRAMKSAYTSIVTLLEQDALSKYDISDAFINFFRDASINKKTINDIMAVKDTIESISRNAFDRSLIAGAENLPGDSSTTLPEPPISEPVPENQPENQSHVQPESGPKGRPENRPEARQVLQGMDQEPAPENQPESQFEAPLTSQQSQESVSENQTGNRFEASPEQSPIPKSVQENRFEVQRQQSIPKPTFGDQPGHQQPIQHSAPANDKADGSIARQKKLKERKMLKMAVPAGGLILLLLIIGIVFWTNSAKNVEDKTYKMSNGVSGTYTGEWKNGKPGGQGTMELENGDVYEGEWVDGQVSGQGTYKWSNDGKVYKGEWLNSACNGQGMMTYADGSTYTGEWQNGYFHGNGTYTLQNGETYTGGYKEGKKEGEGTYTWPDGENYKGEYTNDQENGQGTSTWPDGDSYIGEYKDGKKEGQGTYIWSDGTTYEGEFKNDRREGQGTIIWSDGSGYTGEWKDDKRNGYGTFISADGTKETGIWQDGELVEPGQ